MSIQEELMKIVGYTEKHQRCADCLYFIEDGSTDNFEPGDLCGRNPDIKFSVERNAMCLKYKINK